MAARRRVAALVAVATAALAVAGAAYARTRKPEPPTLTEAQLTAYTSAVLPALRDGGRIVEQEMKPTVGDLTSGQLTGTEFARFAGGWVTDLESVRHRVASVTPPTPLRDAAAGFDDALTRYVAAARGLRDAGLTPAADRRGALDRALDTARSADAAYDRASAVIQRWRAHLGLGPSSEFPDPSPAPSEGP